MDPTVCPTTTTTNKELVPYKGTINPLQCLPTIVGTRFIIIIVQAKLRYKQRPESISSVHKNIPVIFNIRRQRQRPANFISSVQKVLPKVCTSPGSVNILLSITCFTVYCRRHQTNVVPRSKQKEMYRIV